MENVFFFKLTSNFVSIIILYLTSSATSPYSSGPNSSKFGPSCPEVGPNFFQLAKEMATTSLEPEQTRSYFLLLFCIFPFYQNYPPLFYLGIIHREQEFYVFYHFNLQYLNKKENMKNTVYIRSFIVMIIILYHITNFRLIFISRAYADITVNF